mgnify:CR=1 FL=1
MVKRGLYGLLAFILVLMMAACGSGKGGNQSQATGGTTPSETSSGSSGEAKSTPSETPQKRYVIKFSLTTSTDNHPLGMGAVKFKELVEQRSNGQFQVELYPSLQLGSLREQIEQVQLGTTQITMAALATMTNFVEDVQLILFPFLWPDEDTMWEILNGEVGQAILANMQNEGMIGFGVWPNGFMEMTSGKKPIRSVADLKGFKMRVIPAPLLIAQYETWGAEPVPLDLSEVYTSLQQGVVDGQENPLTTIRDQRYEEVQDHLTLSNHSYQASIFTVNKQWFESLPADLQQIFRDSEKEARLYAIEQSKVLNNSILENYRSRNAIEIHELTPEASKEFEVLSKPLHEKFSKTDYQKELLQKVYQAIEAARK